jgi:hypothetical protein
MTTAVPPVTRALDQTVLTGMTRILVLQRFIVAFSQVRESRPLEKLHCYTREPAAPFFLVP